MTVTDYVAARHSPEREILDYLCTVFAGYPQVTLKIRYGIPFVYGRTWICYLHVLRKGGVELNFIRARDLHDPLGLLHSRGRKMVMGTVFHDLEAIPEMPVRDLFEQALRLDSPNH